MAKPFKIGDRVATIKDELFGTLRFDGPTKFSAGRWLGVQLDEPKGRNDGTVNDVRYFTCKTMHGIFVKESQIRHMSTEEAGATVATASVEPQSMPRAPSPRAGSPLASSGGSAGGGGGGARSRLEELKEKRNAALLKIRETASGKADAPTDGPSTTTVASLLSGTSGSGSAPPPALAPPPHLSIPGGTSRRQPPGSGPSPHSRESLAPRGVSTASSLSRRSLAPTSSTVGRRERLMPPRPGHKSPREPAGPGSAGGRTPTEDQDDDAQSVRSAFSDGPEEANSQGGGGSTVDDDSSIPDMTRVHSTSSPADPLDAPSGRSTKHGVASATSSSTLASASGTTATTAANTGSARRPSATSADARRQSLAASSVKSLYGKRPSLTSSTGAASASLSGRRQSFAPGGDASGAVRAAGLEAVFARKSAEVEALKAQAGDDGGALREETERADRAERERGEALQRVKDLEDEVAWLKRQSEAKRGADGDSSRVSARDAADVQVQVMEQQNRELSSKVVELEAEVNALKAKASHAQEEDKAKWTELAKEKAAAAAAVRKIQELETQVTSLNDALELLTLDKEQLNVDKELLEERVEELALELETARLEVEVAASAVKSEESGAGGGDDAKVLAEQNAKLRAALLKLQEVSQHEKSDLLRRQRELEREAAAGEAARRELLKLKEWRIQTEQELEHLREQVDVSQAFEQMVERLTDKNLELEEKVADLRVTVQELEVAQELAEELEATQAEEAASLRQQVDRAIVALSEKEAALRTLEAQVGDRDRTLARFRAHVTELSQERDGLRDRIEAESTALGEARGRAQDVLGQVQSLRTQAKAARTQAMTASLAAVVAQSAEVRASRLAALIPREMAGDESGAIVDGDLLLCTVAAKATSALQLIKQGWEPWGLSKEERESTSRPNRQESPTERVARAGFEGSIASALARAQRFSIYLLSRAQTDLAEDPERAAAVSIEASGLFKPLDQALDALLRVIQHEGGVPPESRMVKEDLEQALAAAGGVSLLREGDHEREGVAHMLWSHTVAHANLALVPVFSLCMLAQAATLAEELGGLLDAQEALPAIQSVFREALRAHARCVVRVERLGDVLPPPEDSQPSPPQPQAMADMPDAFADVSSALLRAAQSDRGDAAAAEAMSALFKVAGVWTEALAVQRQGSVRAPVEGHGALFAAVGPTAAAVAVRAAVVRKKLVDAMEMQALLEATRESERRLLQDMRTKEREHETMRAKIESLESLLSKSADRTKHVEKELRELEVLRAARDNLAKENQVLAEALEVLQQQADALETENRKLRSLRSIVSSPETNSPAGIRSVSPPPGKAGAIGATDTSAVSSALLSTMQSTLKFMSRELAYWKGKALKGVLLGRLRPLFTSEACAAAAVRASASSVPEATGQEGTGEERLKTVAADVARFAKRVAAARVKPRVVNLGSGRRGRARDQLTAQKVQAARLLQELETVREQANIATAEVTGAVGIIRGAPPSQMSCVTGKPPLIGRVKMKGCAAEEEGRRVPVLVGADHMQFLLRGVCG